MTEREGGITAVHIPIAMYGLGIDSPVALGVVALAWSFDASGGLRASNNTLAHVFSVHRQNFIRVVSKLTDDGLVEVEKLPNGRVITVAAKVRRLMGSLKSETTESESSLKSETTSSLKSETKVVSSRRPKLKEVKGKVRGARSATRGKKPFTPPTATEVADYADSLGHTIFDGERFVRYYEDLSWHHKRGGPVRDWRQTVRSWIRRDNEDRAKKGMPPLDGFSQFGTHKATQAEIEALQAEGLL